MNRLKIIFYISCLILLINPFVLLSQDQDNAFDKVVIDAGHGGNDLGAPGTLANEKDIVLALAVKVGALIDEHMPELQVIYTRDDDRFVPLHERAAIANENLADLFISIHCNSNTEPEYFGAETYVMGIHKSEENLEVAKTENAAILMEEDHADAYDGFDPESDEDYIMLNMFQSSTLEESIHFSMLVQKYLDSTAGMYDRGVKQAGFVVLYLTTMPGVLIETGFLSNPAEEKYLLDPDNQDKIAMAIFEAIRDYQLHHEALKVEDAEVAVEEVQSEPVMEKSVYRICFAVTDVLIPFDDKMFGGIGNIWVFSKDGKYYYTFGEVASPDEAQNLLKVYLASGKHRKDFNTEPWIVKFTSWR